MKSQYVEELKPGEVVKEKFVLTKKIIRDKKNGGIYAIVEFTDRSGSIDGIAWNGDDLEAVTVGDFVFVTGNVNEYGGRMEVVVNSISLLSEDEIDVEDFLPKYEGEIDKVMSEIIDFKSTVKNGYLQKLLNSFFVNQQFVEKFKLAPAAKRAHHAYLGGLAVHTLNVLKLLKGLKSVYGFLNFDLIITAGILHDVGKIHEYTYVKKIDLSTHGRMLGHIVIGNEMVAEEINKIPDFPEDLKLKLLHMILSHHGEIAWGSPKQPVFPEALILHFIDNLDSKLEMMIEEFKKNKGKEKKWSDYHPYLEREIYLGEET